MKRNYELYECDECLRQNLAAKAADLYESNRVFHSYLFATKLQNSIRGKFA